MRTSKRILNRFISGLLAVFVCLAVQKPIVHHVPHHSHSLATLELGVISTGEEANMCADVLVFIYDM